MDGIDFVMVVLLRIGVESGRVGSEEIVNLSN